jgi:hypothetical protein
MPETSSQIAPHSHSLATFIESARKSGLSYEMIRNLLLSAGWKDQDICQTIANQELHLPVPTPNNKDSARHTFYLSTHYTCLYVSFVALINFLFGWISYSSASYATNTSEFYSVWSTVLTALSCLSVFLPLCLFMNWPLRYERSSNGTPSAGRFACWLTYLTLFLILITALIVFSSLILSLFNSNPVQPIVGSKTNFFSMLFFSVATGSSGFTPVLKVIVLMIVTLPTTAYLLNRATTFERLTKGVTMTARQ